MAEAFCLSLFRRRLNRMRTASGADSVGTLANSSNGITIHEVGGNTIGWISAAAAGDEDMGKFDNTLIVYVNGDNGIESTFATRIAARKTTAPGRHWPVNRLKTQSKSAPCCFRSPPLTFIDFN